MSTVDVPKTGFIRTDNLFSVVLSFLAVALLSKIAKNIYSAFYGPLSKFPGPTLNSLTIVPWLVSTWKGRDNLDIPALHQQYGPVVRIAPNQLSFAGDGQYWKDIHGFRKAGQPEIQKDRLFYGEGLNRTPGLITADIPTHSRQRKIVSHAFSDKALKEQEPMLKQWAGLLREKLTERAQADEKMDMVKMYNCTTFDIMGDLTFAEPLFMLQGSEYVPWVKNIFGGVKFATYLRAFKYTHEITNWIFEELMFRNPTIRKKFLVHWRFTTDRVDRRLDKEPDRPDLWTRIIEKGGHPTKAPEAEGLSLQEHYSIASLFMIAGTETTATALSGITYLLLKNPEYMKKLQKELRESLGSLENLNLEAMQRLPFLDAVIKEGLRMYPPVPIGLPRISPVGGVMIGGNYVPEGTQFAQHHMATYRYPGYFKDAYSFRPERWLGDPEFKNDKLDALEPFSVGPRNCLGKNLAWHEMRLLLSTVIVSFDLELCPESDKWTEQKVFTLWEKRPLMCKLTPVRQ